MGALPPPGLRGAAVLLAICCAGSGWAEEPSPSALGPATAVAAGQPAPPVVPVNEPPWTSPEQLLEFIELERAVRDRLIAAMEAATPDCNQQAYDEARQELDRWQASYAWLLQHRRVAGEQTEATNEIRNGALADLALDRPAVPPLQGCTQADTTPQTPTGHLPVPESGGVEQVRRLWASKPATAPLSELVSELETQPGFGLEITLPLLRRLASPPPPPSPPPACPAPGRAPIEVGPNGEVGSGARLKSKAGSMLLGAVGGLIGGGGGGGGGAQGPRTVRCKIKDSETTVFADPATGLELRIGARQQDDGLVVYAGIDTSPDSGTFQTAFMQEPTGEVLAPADVGICDLWGEWSLTVSWTKSTYVDGQLVSQEGGGWAREGLFSIPGVLSPADDPDGLWKRLGFSNASHGARRVALAFPVDAARLGQGPVDLVIHVTQPDGDPVTTVPFVLTMASTPDGVTFTRADTECPPVPEPVVVTGPRPVVLVPPGTVLGANRAEGACPAGDPCAELERQLATAVALRDYVEQELLAARATASTIETQLAAAEQALEDAEKALEEASTQPKAEAWIQDAETGQRIDSRDLRLRRSKSRKAWEQYKAGELTAEELQTEWERLGEQKVLDELRREDDAATAERVAAATRARDAARSARDQLLERQRAQMALIAELEASLRELTARARDLLAQLIECRKKQCPTEEAPEVAIPADPQESGEPSASPPGVAITGGPGETPGGSTPEQPEDPCFCGPEMASVVTEAVNRLRTRVDGLPDSEKGVFDGTLFMKRNGGSFDSPPAPVRRPDAPEDAAAGESWLCPSPKCTVFDPPKPTGMLCGYCLPFHMYNEILASFVGSGVGVPRLVFSMGANTEELKYYGKLEGNAPNIAYDIGYALEEATGQQMPMTIGNLCAIVSAEMERRYPVSGRFSGALLPDIELGLISNREMLNIEYPNLADCKMCPDTAPGRFLKDFSRQVWRLGDDTKVGEEYEPAEEDETADTSGEGGGDAGDESASAVGAGTTPVPAGPETSTAVDLRPRLFVPAGEPVASGDPPGDPSDEDEPPVQCTRELMDAELDRIIADYEIYVAGLSGFRGCLDITQDLQMRFLRLQPKVACWDPGVAWRMQVIYNAFSCISNFMHNAFFVWPKTVEFGHSLRVLDPYSLFGFSHSATVQNASEFLDGSTCGGFEYGGTTGVTKSVEAARAQKCATVVSQYFEECEDVLTCLKREWPGITAQCP